MNSKTEIKRQIKDLSDAFIRRVNASFKRKTALSKIIYDTINDYQCETNCDLIDLIDYMIDDYTNAYDLTIEDLKQAISYLTYVTLRIEF